MKSNYMIILKCFKTMRQGGNVVVFLWDPPLISAAVTHVKPASKMATIPHNGDQDVEGVGRKSRESS